MVLFNYGGISLFECFYFCFRSCPDSVSMLTESGLLYLKVGQTQLAFERLTSALALSPSNYEALLGVGCITQVKKFISSKYLRNFTCCFSFTKSTMLLYQSTKLLFKVNPTQLLCGTTSECVFTLNKS